MAITVKHNKVSTIPDTTDTSLIRPSDWNADHTLVGTIDVANGGTGASTLTGYVKGNGTSAMTASATIPSGDITGFGTIATQNANAVAITGGTIDNTTIGATTPSTVNATTITGQTGVLRGTGQNFLLQSQSIGTSPWATINGGTLTTNTVTAPDSTTTASTLTATTGTTHTAARQYPSTVIYPATYTTSVYAKKGTSNYLYIANVFMLNAGGNTTGMAWFNLNTGTVGTVQSGVTATITSAGNGWYRCTASGLSSSTNSFGIVDFGISDADNSQVVTTANNIYLWGSQFEFGSTANTYTLTTTAAVYNAPTLSFNNNAQIGMQSDGSLYVSPAGTGALQAQATTSTTAGGNARGANAVDWQTSRSTAGGVANGSYSVVGGGAGNFSSSGYAIVAGGLNNGASGFGSIVSGGSGNAASAAWTFVGASTSNTASGQYGSVVCGNANTASGFYGFVGNGFTNSTTANAAVTTQSGTMNGTTAVTLSGSNANIKVGQYISGTSIAADTYVAVISGTSLTLSKAASGSSTSTLSFFTPHGVVVGGGNNQATGSYSFIGGGGDAGSSANRNVASGDWSVVAGGRGNTASGIGAFVGGGGLEGTSSALGNTASGLVSFIGGGLVNQATSNGASILGGYQNTANGQKSTVVGGSLGTTRGITANIVFSASNQSISGNTGVTQAGLLILGRQTTDATATALTSDPNAAGTTNQVILPNNSAYFFTGEVISGVTGGGDTKGWTIEGVIKRGANAAATTLVGVTVTSMYADVGAATWTIGVTADTTNGGLRVTFTGQASTTIRTVCQIRTTEMTY